MACKCIRKLMLVIMELLILILLKVQANDLAQISFHSSSPSALLSYFRKLDKVQTKDISPTSFCPSPLPIMYPHCFELDEIQGTIHTCVTDDEIKFCEIKWPHRRIGFQFCIISAYTKCWLSHHVEQKMTTEHILCVHDCVKHRSDIGTCCNECNERHSKTHSDVVYTQYPKHKIW
jgi:hypothetical protein